MISPVESMHVEPVAIGNVTGNAHFPQVRFGAWESAGRVAPRKPRGLLVGICLLLASSKLSRETVVTVTAVYPGSTTNFINSSAAYVSGIVPHPPHPCSYAPSRTANH